jgi:1,4-alpha-glucan branching enzyme
MNRKPLGNFVLVLHTHLPFVINHGLWPHGMEWLFEAASETYIPLLNVLNDLLAEGRRPRLSISMTPVLAEQLSHPFFLEQFEKFLDDEMERAVQDIATFPENEKEKQFIPLSEFWFKFYHNIRSDFTKKYNRNLMAAFRKLQDQGVLDIITCGATHGYFPLLGLDSSIQAQVKMAIATHEKFFGRKPRGIWLPECAYRPRYPWKPMVPSSLGQEPYFRKGVEEILEENNLEYFIVDSSLVEGAKALIGMYIGRFEKLKQLMMQFPKSDAIPESGESHSVHEIYAVKSSVESSSKPVAIFARDVETSMQVWSSEMGYPGGEWYLDFHKKHHQSGHRYWRVTSLNADLGLKVLYQPERIESALNEDADHFVQAITSALKKFRSEHGYEGTLTAPFDSELFGHWWFEGPQFLKKVFERLCDDGEVNVTNCAAMMDTHPPEKVIAIPEGSWGAGGNHYVWMNHDVAWMWERIYNDEAAMHEAVTIWDHAKDVEWITVLKQMARELFLLQASDWQFLISTQSANDYSTKRFTEHHEHFTKLFQLAKKKSNGEYLSAENVAYLSEIKAKDFLFDGNLIDLNWFA